MAGWISVIKTTIRRITISAELYLVAYIIACSVISDKRIPLFNAWFPCDMALSPAYELINIQQSIAATAYVFTVYPFPCFFATLVCITGSQLEKLRARLLNIKLKRDTAMQQESGAETDLEEVFRHMQKELNECVRQHQEILRYIRELEDSLNVFMTGVFLLSLISMCLCAFSIVTSWGDHFMMLQGVIAYSMALVPLVFYCWFGYELTAQTQRIKDAAWGCDWVGTPVSFQKSIRLIISSANKEFTLTAGKIVPVTISTMVNMVNQSVSYFMFLLEVKDSIETDE
ncbi:odorant receptor 2a-like isoform X1 [Zootermopsis nevadensis]|nr:odorant receptor 2a-like isoform X1 [Zootermopsis nevadensis]